MTYYWCLPVFTTLSSTLLNTLINPGEPLWYTLLKSFHARLKWFHTKFPHTFTSETLTHYRIVFIHTQMKHSQVRTSLKCCHPYYRFFFPHGRNWKALISTTERLSYKLVFCFVLLIHITVMITDTLLKHTCAGLSHNCNPFTHHTK